MAGQRAQRTPAAVEKPAAAGPEAVASKPVEPDAGAPAPAEAEAVTPTPAEPDVAPTEVEQLRADLAALRARVDEHEAALAPRLARHRRRLQGR